MVRMKNQGFTLVSVLITSTIAMITGAALLKMIRVYAAAERGVASNAELEHFASTLSSILERKESCEKSGLVGLTLDPDSVTATASPSPFTGQASMGLVASLRQKENPSEIRVF